jgi:carbamoyltransferase
LKIIGVHNTGILSSAALVVDGRLVSGMAEERLDRRKYSKYFPHKAVAACLNLGGLTLDDVDCFAIGWNPAINIGSRYRAGFSEWPAYPGERFYSNPNHLLPLLGPSSFTATDQIFHRNGAKPVTLTYVSHHLAHLAGSYHLSGFTDAALFSCDGYGERTSTVWAVGRAGEIEILREMQFPHSLGSFYSAITEFLGFKPDLDEWKVMGAAAYGDPARFAESMALLVPIGEDGAFRLDLSYFNHFDFDTAGMLTPAAHALFGAPRREGEDLSQRHLDIAAAAQFHLERVLKATLGWLRSVSRMDRVCIGGGVAMNSLFNGRLALDGPFEQVFLPFAPDDSGNSIGAALWAARRAGDCVTGHRITPFLGTSHDDDAIGRELARFGLPSARIEDPAETAAGLLADGRIVGWFQGRMEFGQRALGARSILADPRDAAMKDRVNLAVKFREAFRPFAPAVLVEEAHRYFSIPEGFQVPFMEKVVPIRPEMRGKIPAVTHADGTGRVQTVDRELNPLFHRLISAFGRRTAVPVVLNTSFNLNGEPIVESPADAVRTFMSSGMNALVIGHHLLVKE